VTTGKAEEYVCINVIESYINSIIRPVSCEKPLLKIPRIGGDEVLIIFLKYYLISEVIQKASCSK
jgi:hypothetical protein